MAGKKFTLAVVFLLGALAFGQENTQGTGTAGVATFTWNSSVGAGQFSSYASAGEAPTQSSSLPDTIGTGAQAGGSAGSGASIVGYAGGDIPLSVLASPVLQQASSAVNLMGSVAAIAGATAVGDVPAGIGVLISLFPQYAPGANCPGCAIGMVPGGRWQGPTRVGLAVNTLEGFEAGGANWGGLGEDHTFDVIDLRSGRNIGTITGWQNAETGVARVENTFMQRGVRGEGLGGEGYHLWENSLPKSINRITLSARTTPDAQGRIPRDFWLQMGFRDSGIPIQNDLEGDQFVTMIKHINH
jgi:hypothetical protein